MNILITGFKTILLLFLTIPTLFGILLTRSAWRMKYFVTGVGTVVDAKVTERVTVDNEVAHSIEIKMKYEVDGKNYERPPCFSSRSGLAGLAGLHTYEDYVQELKAYPIGARLEIFYDPDEPESYTLQGDSGPEQWGCAALVLVPSLVALATVLLGW